MPPKKKQEDEKPVLIGRMGTNLKCGIVGIPNVGKSTFFNVLTKSQAAAENFPFCTIDPNESRVPVPDPRFDFLCEYFKPASKVPSFLNVVDIAGLVKGAHEGQGLGNAFLSHIRACDAIFHMCRIFEDDEVTHVEGEVNPVRDMEIIHEELRLKDLDYLEKNLEHLERTVVRGGDKARKAEYDVLKKVHTLVSEEKRPVRFGTWDAKEIEELNKHMFITAKPMMYLLNMSEKDYIRKKNKWLIKIKEWVDVHDPGSIVIPFSGALELKLIDKDEADRASYLKELQTTSALEKIIITGYRALHLMYFFTVGPDEVRAWTIQVCLPDMFSRVAEHEILELAWLQPALDKIILNGYAALGLMYFFTAGEDEVKAWTIQKNTKAPQAAGKIHTDFEKGFIMAEVMKFDDFKAEGSEAAVKAAGKYKQKGRDYVVEDGDIIHFKFNAGAGLTAGGAAAKKK